jgi:hypothetical protein
MLPTSSCRRGRVLLSTVTGLLLLSGCSAAGSDTVESSASSGGGGGTVAASTASTASRASTASTASTASKGATGTATAPVGAETDPDEEVATDPPRPSVQAGTGDVVLSYLYWDGDAVLAGGYVSPVIEDGGTCTLELTQGGETASASSTASADATTTACAELSVSGDELSPGKWSGVLRYSSDTTSGASDALAVEVQG